jgi:hypothetical protein
LRKRGDGSPFSVGSASGTLVGGAGTCPLDVGANPLGLVAEFGTMGDTGNACADHIDDAERSKEPVATGERRVEHGRGGVVALG